MMDEVLTEDAPSSVWWTKIKEVTDRAAKSGALKSFQTTTEKIGSPPLEGVISQVASLNLKPQTLSSTTTPSESKVPFNPFLPPDPDLFVGCINGTHNLILNKYNVVPYHCILATTDFKPQTDPLDKSDFRALWLCLSKMNALGFYNCGLLSGASQPHKHIQLVPLPFDSKEGRNFPLEPLFDSSAAEVKDKNEFTIKEFEFKHSIAKLDTSGRNLDGISSYLEDVFMKLFRSLQLDEISVTPEGKKEPKSYNFVMTPKYMMMVPRSQEKFNNISVNSLGFVGALLSKSVEDTNKIKSIGLAQILKKVAVPL